MNGNERDLYKKALEQMESPGFKSAYWKELEIRLDKRKRRKRAVLIAVPLVVLSVFFALQKQTVIIPADQVADNSVKAVKKNLLPLYSDLNSKLFGNTTAHDTAKLKDGKRHILTLSGIREIFSIACFPQKDTIDYLLASENCNVDTGSFETGAPLLVSRGLHLDWVSGDAMLQGDIAAARKKMHRRYFHLDFSVGVNRANQILNQGNYNASGYLERRLKEERDAWFISPRLMLNFVSRRNCLFSVGMEYQGYGERVGYAPYLLKPSTIQNHTYVSDSVLALNIATGALVWRVDSNVYISWDTVIGKQNDASVSEKNGRTRMSYFEVPITVGYQTHFKGFNLAIQTGFSFGWLHQSFTRGNYLNENGSDLVSLAHEQYSISRFTTSYLLKLRLGTDVGQRFYFFAEPSLKANLGSLYRNQYVAQRYTLSGVYMGIGLKL